MSRLKWNAYLGAGLAVALVIAGLTQLSRRVFEPKPPARPGLLFDFDFVCGTCGDEAEAGLPDWGSVLPHVDPAIGQATFAKCASCHTIAAGGADQNGPNLYGIVGRKPASRSAFPYSDAMSDFAAKTSVWDEDRLFAFLQSPQKHLPGTKMTFVGIKKDEERIALIGYLRTQGAALPLPPPDPGRQQPETTTATE